MLAIFTLTNIAGSTNLLCMTNTTKTGALTAADVEALQRRAGLWGKPARPQGGELPDNQMDHDAWFYADQEVERRRHETAKGAA